MTLPPLAVFARVALPWTASALAACAATSDHSASTTPAVSTAPRAIGPQTAGSLTAVSPATAPQPAESLAAPRTETPSTPRDRDAPSRCALPPASSAAARPRDAGRARDRNVLGTPLAVCSLAPQTGFYRDGRCATGPDDRGVHVVCAEVTRAFLDFTGARGNDLVTPVPGRFPGLRPGDRWCLCAARWEEARVAGVAPPVVLEATEARALDFIPRAALEAHALGVRSSPRAR
jgi:uncharacterized protein (DUF2237 family)